MYTNNYVMPVKYYEMEIIADAKVVSVRGLQYSTSERAAFAAGNTMTGYRINPVYGRWKTLTAKVYAVAEAPVSGKMLRIETVFEQTWHWKDFYNEK